MKRDCFVAREMMTKNLVTLRGDTNALDAIGVLLRGRISGAPVVDEQGSYLGVFSEKCCMNLLNIALRLAEEEGPKPPGGDIRASDFMATRPIVLEPEMDVFDAIDLLLKREISGAPVVQEQTQYGGMFSEKSSMRVLVDAAYDQMPTSRVGAFMDTDQGRVIEEDLPLADVARLFQHTHFRRLAVLSDGRLSGHISRRDVLRAEFTLIRSLPPAKKEKLGEALLKDYAPQEGQSSDGSSPRPAISVAAFMDTQAQTVAEDVDLLSIIQIFSKSNYRRLPIVRDNTLLGQISRRNVLHATHSLMESQTNRDKSLLYLSALVNPQDAPF